MKVFVDTSVLVASLVQSHPHHARAMTVIRRVLAGRDRGHVAAHGLAETYAVLTNLPLVPRVGPEVAMKMLAENILSHFATVALTSREYARVVASLAEEGITGGSVYDAIQVECARKIAAQRIYTFSVGHFNRVAKALANRIAAP